MVRGVGWVVDGDSDQVSVATLVRFATSGKNIAVHTGEVEMRPQRVNGGELAQYLSNSLQGIRLQHLARTKKTAARRLPF